MNFRSRTRTLTVLAVGLWLGLQSTGPAVAHSPLPSPPQARSDGQYWLRHDQSWPTWEVTADQLVARQTEQWPEDEEEPGALLDLDWKVWEWSEVARFPKGTVLKARPLSTGDILIKDLDGGTWMRVEGPGGMLCFVRARGADLKPVHAPGLMSEHRTESRSTRPAAVSDDEDADQVAPDEYSPPPLPRPVFLDRR